jgi:peptide/histidine transporter 3/4
VAWAFGFGVGTACLLATALAFVAGTPWYRVQMPTGSPLKDIVRVLVTTFRKCKANLAREDGAAVPLHWADVHSIWSAPTGMANGGEGLRSRLLSLRILFSCVWLESRGSGAERSGVDPIPRLFGRGAVGAERLQREYTL